MNPAHQTTLNLIGQALQAQANEAPKANGCINALTRHLQLRLKDVVPDDHKEAIARGVVDVYVDTDYRVWPAPVILYIAAKTEDPVQYLNEVIAQANRSDVWTVVTVPMAPGFMVTRHDLIEMSWTTYKSASAPLAAHEVLLEAARKANASEATEADFDHFCVQLEDRGEDTVPKDKWESFVGELVTELCGPRMCSWPPAACRLMINIYGTAGNAYLGLQPLVAQCPGWTIELDGEDIVVQSEEQLNKLPHCGICGGYLPFGIGVIEGEDADNLLRILGRAGAGMMIDLIVAQRAYGGDESDETPGPEAEQPDSQGPSEPGEGPSAGCGEV